MKDAEREALVERMAEAAADADLWPGAWAGGAALGHGCPGRVVPPMPEPQRYVYRRRMRAALSVAERVVREDEREACLAIVAAWSRDGQSPTAHGIDEGIRARGDA